MFFPHSIYDDYSEIKVTGQCCQFSTTMAIGYIISPFLRKIRMAMVHIGWITGVWKIPTPKLLAM